MESATYERTTYFATNSTAIFDRRAQRPQPRQAWSAPPVAVQHLQCVHDQPVRVGEPFGVRERRSLGQFAQKPRLRDGVDPHLGERQVGSLVRVAAEQPERPVELIGELVEDEVVGPARAAILVHARLPGCDRHTARRQPPSRR